MSTVELVPAAEAPQEPTAAPAPPSIGRKLADAREAQHLSIADVANRLKLSVSQVEALEHDAYDRLPGAVFVRGFARNYARLLRLDPEDIVHSVDAHLPKPPASQPAGTDANIPMPESTGGRWPWLAGIAAAVFLGAALIDVLWEEASRPTPPVVETLPTAAAPVVTEPEPAAATDAPTASAVMAEPVTPAAPAAPAPAVAPAAPAVSAAPAVPAAVATPAPGGRVLHVVFEQACWIQVKDAGGKTLLEGLFPAGSSRQIAAAPPLNVVLGNAPGVRLTYGDRVVDLGAQTRDAVARITLE